jgi:hypothetical protein
VLRIALCNSFTNSSCAAIQVVGEHEHISPPYTPTTATGKLFRELPLLVLGIALCDSFTNSSHAATQVVGEPGALTCTTHQQRQLANYFANCHCWYWA